MIKRMLFICLFIILLTACSANEPAVVKKDTVPEEPNEEPELIEETNEDETEEFIEFSLPEEQVVVNLQMVPILKEYIRASNDRQQTIEDMNLTRISIDSTDLYLLEFSCSNDLCSYLLLDQSKDNQAYLIADLAKSFQTKISPDKSKVLFHFIRKDSTLPIPLTNLVVVDLVEWKPVPLENETDDTVVLDFKWPLITSEWVDDNKVTATRPAVEEPNIESITEWEETGNPNKTIIFNTQH